MSTYRYIGHGKTSRDIQKGATYTCPIAQMANKSQIRASMVWKGPGINNWRRASMVESCIVVHDNEHVQLLISNLTLFLLPASTKCHLGKYFSLNLYFICPEEQVEMAPYVAFQHTCTMNILKKDWHESALLHTRSHTHTYRDIGWFHTYWWLRAWCQTLTYSNMLSLLEDIVSMLLHLLFVFKSWLSGLKLELIFDCDTPTAPGGSNTHLNWRNLPLVHIGVMLSIREAMEALPLVTFYIRHLPDCPAGK